MDWFQVDREGLAKVLERRGKEYVVYELVSNALDTAAKRIVVALTKHEGSPKATIVVEDDDPEGFQNLAHAFTLFAESNRKGDQAKRGRFNFGEKIVLAGCYSASIETVTGTIVFDKDGRRQTRAKREQGSVFTGIIRMNGDEFKLACEAVKKILPPDGVEVIFNGAALPHRTPVAKIEHVYLPTVAPDKEGFLTRTWRSTELFVYEPLPGEVPQLYELGIPVVETGDRWIVDVRQKVPLNLDRDNVSPGYLRDVRVAVVNALRDRLTEADAATPLASEALADRNASSEAVQKVLELRYGEKRAIFDPSDPEANKRLVAEGYKLIHGAQLTAEQWENVRRFEAAKPAGQLAPSTKALFTLDGKDYWLKPEEITYGMKGIARYIRTIAPDLIGREVTAGYVSGPMSWIACYGDGQLVFNVKRLGRDWFNGRTFSDEELNKLIIHELAHELSGDHLSDEFHKACCLVGARLVKVFHAKPQLAY